ncbi:MAG: response regulator [Campylobacterota bacterium]|nr:response regulator [Campylobacterota bacterium]
MFDKEFLKTLTIMYVEDDDSIRGSLSTILKKIFGEVIICNDGNDGVNQFKYYTQERKATINTIISDINMPNLNGIDMVKEIRELDEDVPVIFTTAHGESNYLMDAIKLRIAYYALKPINTTELLQNVSKFCMIEHNKLLVEKKEREISQYMDIMNEITSIFKVDNDENIVEVNKQLLDLSEYEKDELVGSPIQNILHPDTLALGYSDILKSVKDNKPYKGKIKFNSKTKNPFYLNLTVIPDFDDSSLTLKNCIYIGLDQTSTELEKQQTMQRVRKSIIDQRGKEGVLAKRIKELEAEVMKLHQNNKNNQDADFIMETLNKEKQKVLSLNAQISHYEKDLSIVTKQKDTIVSNEKNKRIEMAQKLKEVTRENNLLQSKVIELQSLLSSKEEKARGTTVG